MECKHILIDTKENNTFVKLAKQVDSKWVLFGPHRGLNEEDRIPFELNRISNMASSSNNRAIFRTIPTGHLPISNALVIMLN